MGYPSRRHREAIARLGLTPLHRLSFGPCRAFLDTLPYDCSSFKELMNAT